jgi:hypothetical protein
VLWTDLSKDLQKTIANMPVTEMVKGPGIEGWVHHVCGCVTHIIRAGKDEVDLCPEHTT